ncbi:MAG: hypothetical protein K0V04_13710 [Deltaproteobacteria bacterium]|nr:hypothetical protein [Deltaproteobacteria bacterium]
MDERILFLAILTPTWALLFGAALLVQWRRHGTLEHWASPTVAVLLGHALICSSLCVVYYAQTGLSLDHIGRANSSFANFLVANTLCCMMVDLVFAAALRTRHKQTYAHHVLTSLGALAVLYHNLSGWEFLLAVSTAELTFCFYLRRLLRMLDYDNERVLGIVAQGQTIGTILVRGVIHPLLAVAVVSSEQVMLAEKVLTVMFFALGAFWVFTLVRGRIARARRISTSSQPAAAC